LSLCLSFFLFFILSFFLYFFTAVSSENICKTDKIIMESHALVLLDWAIIIVIYVTVRLKLSCDMPRCNIIRLDLTLKFRSKYAN
jgi:hypothetical protein